MGLFSLVRIIDLGGGKLMASTNRLDSRKGRSLLKLMKRKEKVFIESSAIRIKI